MYKIRFTSKRVNKEFNKFNSKEKNLIEKSIKVLQANPRPVSLQFQALNKNRDVKRVKCKRARLFYIIDDEKKVIHIGKIENRDSKSYNGDPKEWFAAV
ncbi:hypothetical protein V1503_24035 [Bacillus sp. SCS-151]|uniref:hypothetical protein n=1 Tax=Nanhaiella sioensis TaxID=3115293 RepID=UPI0039792AF0